MALRKFLVRDERGTAMVEFAIVLGIIFIPLVFGIIEFGRATWAKTTITAAAREGVRYAIVHGSYSPLVADSTMLANYVKGKTQISPIVVKPAWKPGNDPGDTAVVQVIYEYVPLVPFIPPRTLTSTSRQIIAF